MAISKNFGFGEDEAMLKDAARKFFSANCSAEQLHGQVAANHDIQRPIESIWDQDLWREVGELGWTAACVPETAGGVGLPTVATVAIAEEAGRVAFPSPLIATFSATFVLRECNSPAATSALEQIARGQAATIAITDKRGSWRSEDTSVSVDDGKLSGAAYFVQDAQKTSLLVVSARSSEGVGIYVVAPSADGVDLIADGIADLTRDQAHVVFNAVEAIEVAAPGHGADAIDRAIPAILSVVCADMVGAGEWLLQTTTEYARTRVQFDRPIGFFQAIKHPLVNVMIDIDRAKSLAYAAACAVDEEPSDAERLARMAKSAASEMAVFGASRAVQFHGGIGFTWECFVHIFFKRQMHNAALYGDARYQRSRLCELMLT